MLYRCCVCGTLRVFLLSRLYNCEMDLRKDIAPLIKGDVTDDAEVLEKYSRDTSIFERKPILVVFPKDVEDVSAIVKFAAAARAKGEHISIAPRSAGTDMTGGPLTDSIALVFTKHMNRIMEIGNDSGSPTETGYAVAEPGAYYRDFEKATLAMSGKLLPSYPASREIAALGGMIGNNSGGELTLRYGQTNRYVRELDVVLSDGSRATLKPLSTQSLAEKEKEQSLEGEIYRKIRALIEENEQEIENARPSVSKNSAGYALWDVWPARRSLGVGGRVPWCWRVWSRQLFYLRTLRSRRRRMRIRPRIILVWTRSFQTSPYRARGI